jgi:hypothetical protein
VKVDPIAPVGLIVATSVVSITTQVWSAVMSATVVAEVIAAPAETTRTPVPVVVVISNCPVDSKTAVFVVSYAFEVIVLETSPVEPVVADIYACSVLKAFADGVATTDRNPAVRADAATSAMRCLSVLLDICFLSLVELGNFPISARRSFDLLILFP